MKVHDPPNAATPSATRSPKVASSSMISLGLRPARIRTSCCAAWICRPRTLSMSIAACGRRWISVSMSSRSTSTHTVSSRATALVWCGLWSSIEAKPKNSPLAGSSTTTSWWSSSMVVTRTAPEIRT